jgi:hypothetical protein
MLDVECWALGVECSVSALLFLCLFAAIPTAGFRFIRRWLA